MNEAEHPPAPIARGSGTAVWRQIERAVAADIEAGLWAIGERLPTEVDLAARFGVNRHTLRRAMQALEERGVVRVEQGRGTFVQEQVLDYPVGKRTRFSANVARLRRDPAAELLTGEDRPAPAEAARALGLRVGAPTVFIQRLVRVDGRPMGLGSHWFPARRAAGLVEALRRTGSITAALQRIGVADYTRRYTKAIARMPTGPEARLLLQPRNRAVLVTESLNVDADGRPLDYGVAVFAGDRVQLVFEP